MSLTISDLFNAQDYLTQYPDVIEAIRVGFVSDALDHFTRFGEAEGRSPSKLFDSHFYIAKYPDVVPAIQTGLVTSAFDHFRQFGQQAGRTPIPVFDTNFYLTLYPDVRDAIASGFVSSAYEHFARYGQSENRSPSGLFDPSFYTTPDVAEAIASGFVKNAFDHYMRYGQFENRSPSALFDPNFYLTQYPDVSQAIASGFVQSALEHFAVYGQFENRSSSSAFSSSFYLQQYPDVVDAIASGFVISAFDHYARFGKSEGRLAVSPAPVGVIRGLQWDDINGDGLFSTGEFGLAGWTVFLDQNQNGQQDTGEIATTTDANGNYSFTGLAAGSYTVALVSQDGWEPTYPDDLTAQTINLQVGQTIENINFAVNALPVIETNTGLTVDEGGSLIIGSSELRVTDPDNSATELTYTLTDAPDNGTLRLDGAELGINQTFTQADIDSDRLSYTYAGNPATSDRFTFNVTDGTTTLSSSFDLNIGRVPYLVKDINPGLNSSSPQFPGGAVDVNGTLYFATYGPTQGLWKSDGTEAGTTPVKQNAVPLATVNDSLYFFSDGGLWKSDGTETGTTLIRNFLGSPFVPVNFRNNASTIGNTLYFPANDEMGAELWKSDGTPEGTVLLTDINPDNVYSISNAPAIFTAINDTLYFTAYSSASGQALWKSDGTAEGTVSIKPGVRPVSNLSFATVNGSLYFIGNDGVHGAELWKSDGTSEGTVLVKDINPGVGSSLPGGAFNKFFNVNGTLYFEANDGVNGAELWKSDGTSEGTVLVKDINPGADSSNPAYLSAINDTLYFSSTDGVNGAELWKSDGTPEGTVLVKDINPGANSSNPQDLVNFEGMLYFGAYDPVYGTELWKSDGTNLGTVLVEDINPGIESSRSSSFLGYSFSQANNKLFFSADDGVHGTELWAIESSVVRG
jgi:ELWxxDGT repeat protein